MQKVVLKNFSDDLEPMQAVFIPCKGMNLVSFKKGSIEAIDQLTWPLYEERCAGLGALIGPHFHQRTENIPQVKDASLFPHIAIERSKGRLDPFSHGIARYAPWTYTATKNTISALLKGSDIWNGQCLKDLEGFDFTMSLTASLSPKGLSLKLNIDSEKPSLVGMHYYYTLSGPSKVCAPIKPLYRDVCTWKEIPSQWLSEKGFLSFDLQNPSDYGFVLEGDSAITLHTSTHTLTVSYKAQDNDTSWQLWHPDKGSFVCIEPLSAKDPRKPSLTKSSLEVEISIS